MFCLYAALNAFLHSLCFYHYKTHKIFVFSRNSFYTTHRNYSCKYLELYHFHHYTVNVVSLQNAAQDVHWIIFLPMPFWTKPVHNEQMCHTRSLTIFLSPSRSNAARVLVYWTIIIYFRSALRFHAVLKHARGADVINHAGAVSCTTWTCSCPTAPATMTTLEPAPSITAAASINIDARMLCVDSEARELLANGIHILEQRSGGLLWQCESNYDKKLGFVWLEEWGVGGGV